ncbi:MAG: iron-containing alcohol dehydrogenase [Thermoproteus sp. AZ2]|uniref:Iron-containing alcohol dehydrogenase n=1 Tax=Thermoproteus sp. AZ2 TaxID=1609232 RepID=A0ACC6UZB1_9CREN|nr:MAG: alcohol dehydrogenase [Thermoproteus sp. AZ2]
MWEPKINPARVFELKYAGTTLYFGVGAINKMRDIASDLKSKGISSVLVVAGRSSYKATGAWDRVKVALEEAGINYSIYDKVSPNPTVDMVDEAVEAGKSVRAGAVIGIGGGSPVDTAKAVAVLLATGGAARDLFLGRITPSRALPVVAINTTHGTGTEVNRYGVETIPERMYKIGRPLTYPLYSIDDPQLLVKLDRAQTIATAVDALNHVNESATNRYTTPFAIGLAKEAVRLIAKYLPIAVAEPDNLAARYWLLYASMIAGIAIDHVPTHITHAMQHPTSALKPELPHGVGLGILLPSVLKAIYKAVPETLAEIYEPIAPGFKGRPGEAEQFALTVEEWLFSVGLRQKLSDYGFAESDVPTLYRLLMETPGLRDGLEVAPIKVDEETTIKIYRESLYPLQKR